MCMTPQDYINAAATFFIGLAVFKLIQYVLLIRAARVAKKTKTSLDDATLEVLRTIKPQFYWFLAFYIAVLQVQLTGRAKEIIDVVLLIWLTYQVVVALQIIIDKVVHARFVRKEDRSSEVVSSIISALSRIVLWSTGILFVLSNVGINITSLVAGLGLGGLAFALAARKMLEDLFSSLAIYFDRPFEPGDFIVVGQDKGTVQKVGIKTTRIMALSGEEIVIPNMELTSGRLSNYKRIKQWRVSLDIGVKYETSQEHTENIPSYLKEIAQSTKHVRFESTHFKEFVDSALVFEFIYYVENKSYEVYLDTRQEILLKIKEKFDHEGIQVVRIVKS